MLRYKPFNIYVSFLSITSKAHVNERIYVYCCCNYLAAVFLSLIDQLTINLWEVLSESFRYTQYITELRIEVLKRKRKKNKIK